MRRKKIWLNRTRGAFWLQIRTQFARRIPVLTQPNTLEGQGGFGMKRINNLAGKRIKLARIAQGMRRQEVLERVHASGVEMHPTCLCNMERQTRQVLDFELVALADALYVSVDWLLGRDS